MDLHTLAARLRALTDNFSTGQIVSLVASFVLVVGIVVGSAWWLNAPSYAVLFQDMDAETANQIVSKLKTMKVAYELDAGGTAIRVDRTRVDELRLELTADGMPSSGRIGMELLDRTNFGATEFVEKINFQRALEGEIARTITTLAQVRSARVHIALAKNSLFGEQAPAKASVVVKLRDSRPLPESQVAGIANLVAYAVEGLRPDSVVIVDSTGRPLTQPTDDERSPLGSAQSERQERIERETALKVINLLEPAVGERRVRVNVSARLDQKSREITEEVYDPNAVLRSKTTTSDSATATTSSGLLAGGTAGARANMPTPAGTEPPPTVTPGSSTRTSETANFDISRTTSRTIQPPGEIARLSVAVIIDDGVEVTTDAEGKQTSKRVPRTPEELQKLQSLIEASIGMDSSRGDQVTVQNMTFDDPLPTEPPPPDFWTEYKAPILEGSRIGAVLILGLVALLFVVRPMLRRTGMAPVQVAVATAGVAAAAGAAPAVAAVAIPGVGPKTVAELESAIEAEMDAAAIGKAGERRLPVLARRVAAQATKEPENTAKLIRSWMSERS